MQQTQKNNSIHNFSLDSTIKLNQYLQKEYKGKNIYIATNKKGNIVVVLIQKQQGFLLLHYVYEESQYSLINEQEEKQDNPIINLILNDQGNLLLIIYHEEKNDRYYKKARYQKWTKFTNEQYHFEFGDLFSCILIPYQIESTSQDLSIICATKTRDMVVKHFSINKNQKLVQKSNFHGVQGCFICQQEQFLIIVKYDQINLHSIKPYNFLNLISTSDRVKAKIKKLEKFPYQQKEVQMQIDCNLNLYILLFNKLQIYQKQDNQKYSLTAKIDLMDKVYCGYIKNFTISQNTILFFIYDEENATAFQVNSNQLVQKVQVQWKSLINFQNDKGFIALSNASFSVYKSII